MFLKAKTRVDSSPRLRRYANIIFDDWPEGDEHFQWVATARVSEIVEWAKQIEEDSDESSDSVSSH
jgi:hypothetical protein